jgi:hypothetical protein
VRTFAALPFGGDWSHSQNLTLDLDGLATFANFAGLGLVCGIDFVSGFLKKLADKKRGGFENGGAQ